MPTWSARTAPTMRSSTKSVPPPTTCLRSTTSYAAGNIPTTVCVHTSRWPTSPHWNLSLAGNTILERQSVTNLLDEYSHWTESYFPIKDHTGLVQQVGAIVLELTKRNELQASLVRLTDKLSGIKSLLHN